MLSLSSSEAWSLDLHLSQPEVAAVGVTYRAYAYVFYVRLLEFIRVMA
jgi:hypothetical protein